tara:strand:+ start:770 stop:1540 length:771 start_codon:yes stop_codon:yes gene_type:complete
MIDTPFKFIISNIICNKIWEKHQEGQEEIFIDFNGIELHGNEKGGYLSYKINKKKKEIIVTDIVSKTNKGATYINTGDFPFTYHTHPIVIDHLQRNIENYPNLISDDDLIGSIQDNIFFEYKDTRNICGKKNIYTNGINLFDLLACPYGIFIYRPDTNFHYFKSKNPQLELNKIEKDIYKLFNKHKNKLLPLYSYNNLKNYYNYEKDYHNIDNYIKEMDKWGFIIEFIPWKNALNNGIIINLDSKFNLEKFCNYVL